MPDDTTRFYSTKQVADLLNVSTAHVRRMAKALDLGTVRLGTARMFTDADIAILEARDTTTGPKPRGGRRSSASPPTRTASRSPQR